MKTLLLIEYLTDKEQHQLSHELTGHKRQSLAALFKALRKTIRKNEEPQKAELYKACFSETYTDNKDYLLRNELRLLNKSIEDFILRTELQRECAENPYFESLWLQAAFARRGKIELLNKQLAKTRPKAQEQAQWDYLAESCRHKHMALRLTKSGFDKKNVEELFHTFQNLILFLTRQFVRDLRDTEVHLLREHNSLCKANNEQTHLQILDSIDLHADEFNDAYSLATYCNLEFHHGQKKGDIPTLIKGYEYLCQANVFGKDHNRQKLILLSQLCLFSLRDGKIDVVEKYLKQRNILAVQSNTKLEPEMTLVEIDYLLARERFADTTEYIISLDDYCRQAPRLGNLYEISLALCYLLLNQPAAAREAFNNLKKTENEEDSAIRKLIELCIDFQTGQIEEAERKSDALIEFQRQRSQDSANQAWTFNYYRLIGRLIKLVQTPASSRTQKLQQLTEDIEHAKNFPYNLRYIVRLPLVWLERQVQEISAK